MKLLFKFLGNILLVYLLHTILPGTFLVFGGIPAYLLIGGLLTVLNLLLRPILELITFPLHLVFSLLATIIVNVFFLWVVYHILLRVDPGTAALAISGGWASWILVSIALGIGNWVLKKVLG